MRFEVLKVLLVNIQVCLDVMPCKLVNSKKCSKQVYCFQIQCQRGED